MQKTRQGDSAKGFANPSFSTVLKEKIRSGQHPPSAFIILGALSSPTPTPTTFVTLNIHGLESLLEILLLRPFGKVYLKIILR